MTFVVLMLSGSKMISAATGFSLRLYLQAKPKQKVCQQDK